MIVDEVIDFRKKHGLKNNTLVFYKIQADLIKLCLEYVNVSNKEKDVEIAN